MSILRKLGKSGMFGLAGLAATNKGAVNKIAGSGGLGVMGMLLAKKKRAQEQAAGAMPGRPMVREPMVAADSAEPMMRKGGMVKKMAKGGSTASKRADGCATKGKTKGRFV